MKTVVKAIMAAATLAAASSASALDVRITDVTVGSFVGHNEGFTWSASGVAAPINLNVGASPQTFTYGSFSTSDFGLDSSDINDNNDSFQVRMTLTPPGSHIGAGGTPDASGTFILLGYINQKAGVNFENNWIDVAFGIGGLYQLMFLDSDNLTGNGSVALKGQMRLVKDSAPATVAEPASLALVGLGLLGLAFGRRRAG